MTKKGLLHLVGVFSEGSIPVICPVEVIKKGSIFQVEGTLKNFYKDKLYDFFEKNMYDINIDFSIMLDIIKDNYEPFDRNTFDTYYCILTALYYMPLLDNSSFTFKVDLVEKTPRIFYLMKELEETRKQIKKYKMFEENILALLTKED